MKNILKLFGSIFICFLPGIIGGYFTVSNLYPWFETLVKPSFNPPAEVFSPVWTILYTLMGISLFLIISSKPSRDKSYGLLFFGIQLVLNGLWSIVFFGLHQLLWAFVVIIALLVFIILTMLKFYKIKRIAVYILIPYLLWVSFAAVLNYSLYLLNS